MTKVFAALIIGIFFSIVAFYLIGNVSPWNQEIVFSYLDEFEITKGEEFDQLVSESISSGLILDFIDIKNISLILFMASIGFVGIFASIHMLIDKLFFKKFYEDPDAFKAIRRGAWIPILAITLLFIRLIGGFNTINLVFFFFVLVIILYVEISFTRGERKLEKEESSSP